MGGLLVKQIEKIMDEFLTPYNPTGKVAVLPRAPSFSLERCFTFIMGSWVFSSEIFFQAIRCADGDTWLNAVSFAKLGTSFRPVVLVDSTESCQDLSRNDLTYMIGSIIEEVEFQLASMRQEGVQLATVEDLLHEADMLLNL